MAFSDAFLDELIARTDLVEIVSRDVALTRKGDKLWGLCPFHNEKTASFSVSPTRQMFYCFGCGAGGTVIQYVQRVENIPFQEAIHVLAEQAHLPIPDMHDGVDTRAQKERLFAVCREAARFYHETLTSPQGRTAADYLQTRGITPALVRRFGLGYAPDSWDALLTALTARGFTKTELLDAGLLVKNNTGGLYDRFRGRLMFPIIDLRQKVVAFGGRVLDDSLPKYLNSSDTTIFSKSRTLFALNLARKSKFKKILLTEGYMDVLSLHQAGFDCAVASLGTSLTERHAKMLQQTTGEVLIAYDMDTAGRKATDRAVALLQQAGVSVRILQMENAKDPDEYIRRFGRDAFYRLTTGSKTHMDYKFSGLLGQHDLSSPEGKAAYCKEAVTLLSTLRSDVERDIYLRLAADTAGIAVDALRADVERTRRRLKYKLDRERTQQTFRVIKQMQPKAPGLSYRDPRSARAEEEIIRLLFSDLSTLKEMDSITERDFTVPLFHKVFQVAYARAADDRPLTLPALGDMLSPEELSHLVRVLDRPMDLTQKDHIMSDCVSILCAQRMKRAALPGETTYHTNIQFDLSQTQSGDGLTIQSQEPAPSVSSDDSDNKLRALQETYRLTKGYGGQ